MLTTQPVALQAATVKCASANHATSSPTSATSSEDCVAECEASVSGAHKTTKGDVAGSAQLHPLEGQGHCLGLDGCSRLEQTPAPRWADTEKDKVLEPTLSQKPPIYLGVGTNGWDPEAALSCQISVPGWMEGQTERYRIQSEQFEDLWLITNELIMRLQEYFEKQGIKDFACSFSGSMPLQEYFELIDHHFE
ncbi:hypothetical protein J1605_009758, partial [Eschrichtius robustus]